MTTKKEAPAKTEAAKHIGKYATQIVAVRDRLTLGIARFFPWFQQVDALALLIVALFTAYTVLIVWGWLS